MDDEGLDLKVSLADIYGFNYHKLLLILLFLLLIFQVGFQLMHKIELCTDCTVSELSW